MPSNSLSRSAPGFCVIIVCFFSQGLEGDGMEVGGRRGGSEGELILWRRSVGAVP